MMQRKEAEEARGEEPTEDLSYLQRPADGVFCSEFLASWKDVHSMNMITAALSGDGKTVLTGGADRLFKATPCAGLPEFAIADDASAVEFHGAKAPVLTCAVHPKDAHLVALGCMDGKVHLADMACGEELQRLADHQKYCVRVKWSPCGTMLASASYDHTVCLYRRTPPAQEGVATAAEQGRDESGTVDSGFAEFGLVDQFTCAGAVESITFGETSTAGVVGLHLVAGTRDDHCLTIIDTETRERRRMNMNMLKDSFVSFTPMDLSMSPNGQFILVSTDKDRLLLMSFATGDVVRCHASRYAMETRAVSSPAPSWSSMRR